jgi:hypothetical protein
MRGGGNIVDGQSDDTKRKMSKPKKYSENIAFANRSKGKAVLQLAMDGSFIAKHKIISDAAKAVSCLRSNISACCNHKGSSAGGYKWKFAAENNKVTKHEIPKGAKAKVIIMSTDKVA